MRAVNLIPAEQRRGGVGPGRGGGAVYSLLGGLGVLVLAVAMYVLTANSVKDNQAKLVEVTRQATETEADANRLRAYYDFAQMREKRVATVSALAANRFDWERSLRQMARVLPNNVFLTKFVGTVAPGVSLEGINIADPASLRQKLPVPAFQIVGCTDEQSDVARIMSRLRRMTGVTRVSLSLSEKPRQEQPINPTQLSTDPDCRFDYSIPRFTITVFFEALPGATLAGGGAPPAAPKAAPTGQPGQPTPPPVPNATPTANPGGAR